MKNDFLNRKPVKTFLFFEKNFLDESHSAEKPLGASMLEKRILFAKNQRVGLRF